MLTYELSQKLIMDRELKNISQKSEQAQKVAKETSDYSGHIRDDAVMSYCLQDDTKMSILSCSLYGSSTMLIVVVFPKRDCHKRDYHIVYPKKKVFFFFFLLLLSTKCLLSYRLFQL